MAITLISDTFTDTDGTALPSHTMDTGPGWTAVTGTYQIESNAAVPHSNQNSDKILSDAGKSDVQLDVICTCQFAGGWESDADLIVRWQDANNFWAVQMTAAGAVVQLYEVAAGVVNQRASAPYPAASNDPVSVTVTCHGTTIACYLNGTLAWLYGSAATAQTATKFGLFTGQAGVVATPCSWDNFQVRQWGGTAIGSAAVAGVGVTLITGVGSSTGSGVATGIYGSVPATGSVTGSATVSGVGVAVVPGAGSATGTAAVSGVGASINGNNVVASAAGTATVIGAGHANAAVVGSIAGLAVVHAVGVGFSTNSAVGSATGSATASGVIFITRAGTVDPYRPQRVDELNK